MKPIAFDNTYARLPNVFYSNTAPTPVAQPQLFKANYKLADSLGLTHFFDQADIANYLAGNQLLDGSTPICMAYSGHQFGGFSPQLGDGRAVLLGEVVAPDGKRYDIQLKGSGPTPWSRGGDGRSALGPVIREYLLSEAMYKLDVPTTRALAAVTTGEHVIREQRLPGGILTRVASGFVRVGTFEYFASRGNVDALQQLADYVIARHYPEAQQADNPYAELLRQVVDAQAKLIAKWMSLGFIHGVMNTDNMAISGETIDYGPCAFMDSFSHKQKYSSIDHNGRYAYQNQPPIGQWNLIRLAETLLPLFAERLPNTQNSETSKEDAAVKIAQDILNPYQGIYHDYWLSEMGAKLGLSELQSEDLNLFEDLLDIMQAGHADFTLTFYYLSQQQDKEAKQKLMGLFTNPDALSPWLTRWQARREQQSSSLVEQRTLMQNTNPVYIPRNHQVEAAIRAAEDNNDFSVFEALHAVLQDPFNYQTGKDTYLLPPTPQQIVHQTFCGT